MSEAASLLLEIAGEDEWSRHEALERLRSRGLDEGGLRELGRALEDHEDATRRSAARMALAALASPGSPAQAPAQRLLRDALRSSDPDLRVLAASALGEAGDPQPVGDLIAALDDQDPNVVAAAADALGVLGHPGGIGPLAERAVAGEFWIRAAAVVSLGRIRDGRAIPALARAGEAPGLEEPVIEALRAIGDPAALPVLGTLVGRAPIPALLAAGAILCGHPEVAPPHWITAPATEHSDELKRRLIDEDDPAAARLLGIAAPEGAVDLLLDRAATPDTSEAALAGVLAAPPKVRAEAILERLPRADSRGRVALLSLLPPLEAEDAIGLLVPILDDPDPAVRAAAAEALARAPADRALPLLRERLDRRGAAPEVLRALGGLGSDACLALTPLLADDDPEVRRATADALTRCGGPDIADQIGAALGREPEPAVRASLLTAYGHAAGEGSVDTLAAALSDEAPEVRLAAIDGLAASRSAAALAPLEGPLGKGPPESLAALRAIGDLGHEAGAPLIAPFLRSADQDARRVAAGAAVALAHALPMELLLTIAGDADEWVRICAARALGRRGGASRERLRAMGSNDPSPAVRDEARRSLAGVK